MIIYEIEDSRGKRRKYKTLELAEVGFREGDVSIYEVTFDGERNKPMFDHRTIRVLGERKYGN